MIRGGLRTRFIADSIRVAIVGALSELGWFDATIHDDPPGTRRHAPLRYVPRPVKWDVTVEPNAVAISTEDVLSGEHGLVGEVEDSMRMYVDIFAQSDELGWQLAHDTRDILLGKMPDIGRGAPEIEIFDLRLATPAAFTVVDIEKPLIDRAESESRDWRNRWYMVRFDVSDEYHDEYGGVDVDLTTWPDHYGPIWTQIQAVEGSP
jgi:hypothetical protein